jgi:Protein of unknown function (DUF1553)/Protein of unknown function (DUF1549)/Planctomycete cytochrome C
MSELVSLRLFPCRVGFQPHLGTMRGLSLNAVVFLLAAGAVRAGGDASSGRPAASEAFPPEAVEFFEARVRPILAERCVKCHGPRKQSSGLRLDSREAVLKGGESGPAVVPQNAAESKLIQAVSHAVADLKMPPGGKLAESDIVSLRRWVDLGAPWGAAPALSAAAAGVSTAARKHWSFQPVRSEVPPPVQNRAWVRSPVDAFVLARLESAGIAPSATADKRVLIRRATIDLWGVPPTVEEIDAFEADASRDAFARVVDRLLASPRYGERWARHWLDVARYADTKGYVFTQERRYPYAYTYRDYVVSAFNADAGYDQFIRQQLAADQLAHGADKTALAAMGFLTVGRRFLLDQNEIIDDRIDVVCRGLLGLTVTCARCHDHKFDPIPSEDYYSLYGVFASSVEPRELPLLSQPGAGTPSAADYARKWQAATKARDDYLSARKDETLADLEARFSLYLRAASDLDFNPRHPRLEERALADKLNSRRLKTAAVLWKRRLDASSAARDPLLAPWHALAALPRDGFGVKAAEVCRRLSPPAGDGKAPPVTPLVARAFADAPPSSMADVVARYAALFAQLEARWKQRSQDSKASAAVLTDPEWEALRLALFGPAGVLAFSVDETRRFLDQSQRGRLEQLSGVLAQLDATHPGAPRRAMVMVDAQQPYEPHVFVRGNPGRPGQAVPRRFVRVVSQPGAGPFRKGSGRLELAEAIADPQNPLTARVLVNRVWQWHFGKGLVATASDFGTRSEPPTHPELLDYLASEFMASGWSIKTLHRRIMLSSSYQQQSGLRPDALDHDPENRLLWRFNRQRLDFEAMHDSILAVAGVLDRTLGGPPGPLLEPPYSTRRALYGFIDRQNLDGVYRTFDFATPDATSPRRFVTLVPQQALFLMNSPFLQEQARRTTASIRRPGEPQEAADCPDDPTETARTLYRRVLGRLPRDDELALAVNFLLRTDIDGAPALAAGSSAPAALHGPALSRWEQLAQVLLLTNEFTFVD